LGRTLAAQGKNREAIEQFNVALEADLFNLGALTGLHSVYAQTSEEQRKWEVALKLARHCDCAPRLLDETLEWLSQNHRPQEIVELTTGIVGRLSTQRAMFLRALALVDSHRTQEFMTCAAELRIRAEPSMTALRAALQAKGKWRALAQLALNSEDSDAPQRLRNLEQRCVQLTEEESFQNKPIARVEVLGALCLMGSAEPDLHAELEASLADLVKRAGFQARAGNHARYAELAALVVDATPKSPDVQLSVARAMSAVDEVSTLMVLLPATTEILRAIAVDLLNDKLDIPALFNQVTRFSGASALLGEEAHKHCAVAVCNFWTRLETDPIDQLLKGCVVLRILGGDTPDLVELIQAVAKRSRHAIRATPMADRISLETLCTLHLLLAPEDKDIRIKLARLRMRMHAYDVAKPDLIDLVFHDPYRDDFWRDLAKCLRELDLADDAEVAERHAEELYPSESFA
jgi:tetratricopeptide (TPR) repeat protein